MTAIEIYEKLKETYIEEMKKREFNEELIEKAKTKMERNKEDYLWTYNRKIKNVEQMQKWELGYSERTNHYQLSFIAVMYGIYDDKKLSVEYDLVKNKIKTSFKKMR